MLKSHYPFLTFVTQGGGLAKESGSWYVFVVPPEHSSFSEGDMVPTEWGVNPSGIPVLVNGVSVPESTVHHCLSLVEDDEVNGVWNGTVTEGLGFAPRFLFN